MIVILDTAKGEAYNFKTRNEASKFIGVSRPTLRTWLSEPFFLYKTLIITNTSNEKVIKSNRELLKRHIEKIGEMEIKFERTNGTPVDLSGVLVKHQDVPINGSPAKRTSQVDGAG